MDSAYSLRFLREAARLLLHYNMRSELLERRLRELAHALGMDVRVVTAYRSLTIYGEDGGHIAHAHVPEMRINVAISARVNRVIDEVIAGTSQPAEALVQLEHAEHDAGRHHPAVLCALFGAAAAALAALMGGDAAAMLVIGLSSAAGVIARQALARRHALLLTLPFVAALIGSFSGALMIRGGWTDTPGICLIVPALMLVPGPHFINGLLDVVENNLQTALSRLGLAVAIMIAAAMGVFLGAGLVLGMSTVPPWLHGQAHIPLWADVLLAGVAACGFAAFYNAPWRVLWTSVVCGMLGHGVRYLCLAQGFGLEAATFAGCFVIGIVAAGMVDRMRVPLAAIAFAGAVPMMPGVLMFQSLRGAMEIAVAGARASQTLIAETLSSMFASCMVVGAMGLGLLIGARLAEMALRHSYPMRLGWRANR